MGSLSNLYISQSYTSLIHLGTDGPISDQLPGQFIQLQDGIGNSLNIELNGDGDVNIGGILSASNIPAEITSKGEFNAYTSSTNVRLNNLETTSASVNVSVNALNVFTASQSSASIVASINNLNTFTQSANIRLNNLESTSASVNVSITNINSTTASLNTSVANINLATASLQSQLATIGTQSGSWVTEAETASFARTNVTNTFTEPQIINAAITASAARIANLNYPIADGTFTGQVLQTNAAGTLSFGNVNAVFENVRNGELTTITVGTPLYVSGAQGDTPIVYRADATNPTKMPVTFLAMENIASNATGRGIILGLITGINMTGYPVGTQLWVDGIGQLTDVRPTGSADIVQPIGIVTKTGNGGQLNILNPGPVLLPNIQTGYAWVGNGNNQPVAVATSSFGGGGTTDLGPLNQATASLQAFTASANIRLNNLESTSASVNTSISNINSATASLQSQLATIGTQSGSWITESETASFARYDVNNPWSAPQTFTSITASSALITYLTTVFETSSIIYSSGSNQFGDELTDIQTLSGSVKVEGSLTVNGTPVQTSSVDISNLNQATASLQSFTSSANIRLNNIEVTTASLNTSVSNINTFTQSANQRLTAIETVSGSWVTAAITASSLVTASINNSTNTITFTKGDNTTFDIVVQTGSVTPIDTSSFAILGANQIFTGNNTFIGNTVVSQSAAFGTASFYGPVEITKGIRTNVQITGSLIANKISVYDFDTLFYGSQLGGTTTNGTFFGYGSSDYAFTLGAYTGLFDNELQIYANNGGIEFRDFNGASYPSWLKLLPNSGTNPKPIFTRGLEVTGSTNIAELTASLQNGYVWVGNAAGKTVTVPTSSFIDTFVSGNLVTTASFNSYTQSTDVRLTNLESTTSSLNTSITNINSFTSSANQRLTAIETVSGSWITEAETGSFATTGSNGFFGNQNINGNVLVSGSVNLLNEGGNGWAFSSKAMFLTNSVQTGLTVESPIHFYKQTKGNMYITVNADDPGSSGSMNIQVHNNQNLNISASTVVIDSDLYLDDESGTTKFWINKNFDAEFLGAKTEWNEVANTLTSIAAEETVELIYNGWGSGYDNGYIVNVGTTGTKFQDWNTSYVNQTWLQIPVNNNNNPAPIFTRGLEVTGSTNIAELTASLQNGYVWVGNASGKTTTVATSSFGGGADLGPLNQATASLQQATASLQSFTSSANQRLTAIESVSGSWITEAETGSFAKLDANQIFTGNNTITGNTVVSQSATFGTASFYAPMVISNGIASNVQITGSLIANKVSVFNFDSLFYGSQLGGTIQNGTYFGYGTNDYTHTIGAYSGSFDNELQTYIDSTGIYFKDFNGSGYNTFLKLNPNPGTNPRPIFTRGLEITDSTTITGSLTISSSAAIELNVIGNSVFTGSVAGNVVSASITSNTASIDFNLGNYFEVTSSVTPLHLNITNITPGRTSTLIISASASSSITFSPNVAQPSGSAYSGSLGSIDILSLVAFNTSKVNLVATKALI